MPTLPSAILSAPRLGWPPFNRSRLAGFQRPVRLWASAAAMGQANQVLNNCVVQSFALHARNCVFRPIVIADSGGS
jgi:hypothetical protein